jgi:hypothetical protein
LLFALSAQAGAVQVPQAASGRLELTVLTAAGTPAANATVCVGIAQDLNLYAQGTTDSQGRISVSSVPPDGYLITAHTPAQVAQVSRTTLSPSLLVLTIALRMGTSPHCPTTIAAGPLRKLVGDITFQATPKPGSAITELSRGEFCFGAVGMSCGQPPAGLPASAACAVGTCLINGGSWEHDTCCYATPGGYACNGAASFVGSACRTQWDKAVRLTTKGLSWTRTVDFSRANSSGVVEHTLYCAPEGTLVPPDDASKCCSGQSRALTAAEQVAVAAKMETLRVCSGRPSAPVDERDGS